MVFFTDVRIRIVHFKKFYIPTFHYYYKPLNCLYQRQFSPIWLCSSIISSSSMVQALLKSLWTLSHGKAGFYLQLKIKPPKTRDSSSTHCPTQTPLLCSSVITVGQRLILRWEQRGRLSLPDPVLLVRSCLVHRGSGTCDRGWWCAAEHPHSQRVIRKLSWAW